MLGARLALHAAREQERQEDLGQECPSDDRNFVMHKSFLTQPVHSPPKRRLIVASFQFSSGESTGWVTTIRSLTSQFQLTSLTAPHYIIRDHYSCPLVGASVDRWAAMPITTLRLSSGELLTWLFGRDSVAWSLLTVKRNRSGGRHVGEDIVVRDRCVSGCGGERTGSRLKSSPSITSWILKMRRCR